MIKQLRKVGNSNALILDKPILELIGLEEDGSVQLKVSDGALIVTPVDPSPVSDEKFQECLDRVVKQWGSVLERLAK